MATIKVETMGKTAPPALAVDQIWKEGDSRAERYVRVQELSAKPGKAKITSCTRDGTRVGVNSSFAKHERFNNKSSGYTFVSDKTA